MPDSLYRSLLDTLNSSNVGPIANALGQRDQSVFRCLEHSVTSIFAALTQKAGDTGGLRRLLDLAPSTGDLNWSRIAGEVSNPSSSLLSSGKAISSSLFGNSQGAISNWISRECGLASGTTSTLMTMAGPMVMGFLGRRMHADGMDTADLGRALQRESSVVKAALPPGLSSLISPATTTATTTGPSPVVAQAVRHERGFPTWIPVAVAIAVGIFGLSWALSHRHRPNIAAVAPTGEASREVPAMPTPAPTARATLPKVDLKFQTGTATLLPGSQVQLHSLASFLAANPGTHVAISGYTDNQGNAGRNLQLSQARANSVMAALVRDGVSPDRLTAHGYGEANPIADNSTAQGRLQNRRVTIN